MLQRFLKMKVKCAHASSYTHSWQRGFRVNRIRVNTAGVTNRESYSQPMIYARAHTRTESTHTESDLKQRDMYWSELQWWNENCILQFIIILMLNYFLSDIKSYHNEFPKSAFWRGNFHTFASKRVIFMS